MANIELAQMANATHVAKKGLMNKDRGQSRDTWVSSKDYCNCHAELPPATILLVDKGIVGLPKRKFSVPEHN